MRRYPKRVETAVWRIIDNQAVIVSPMDSEITILNEAGTLIWKLIDGAREINQIAKELCREYEVSQEEVKKDIEEFIEDLMHKKMVTISEE